MVATAHRAAEAVAAIAGLSGRARASGPGRPVCRW